MRPLVSTQSCAGCGHQGAGSPRRGRAWHRPVGKHLGSLVRKQETHCTPCSHFTPEVRGSGLPSDHPPLLCLGAPLLLVPKPHPCPVMISPNFPVLEFKVQPGQLAPLSTAILWGSPRLPALYLGTAPLLPSPPRVCSWEPRSVFLGAQKPPPCTQPDQAPSPSFLCSSPISIHGKSSCQALSPKAGTKACLPLTQSDLSAC